MHTRTRMHTPINAHVSLRAALGTWITASPSCDAVTNASVTMGVVIFE